MANSVPGGGGGGGTQHIKGGVNWGVMGGGEAACKRL